MRLILNSAKAQEQRSENIFFFAEMMTDLSFDLSMRLCNYLLIAWDISL